jgi:nicotinamide mononucleotide adenylyltransferase
MEKIIVKANSKTQGANKYALFIGRWQPFHDGHQWLVDQKLEQGENVCIAIRDMEVDESNWWKAKMIEKDLKSRFKKEIKTGKIKVVIIPDIDSINIGREVGYDIIEHTPPTEISKISGTKIRKQILKEQQSKTQES